MILFIFGIQVFLNIDDVIEEHYLGDTFLILEALIGEAIRSIEYVKVFRISENIWSAENIKV